MAYEVKIEQRPDYIRVEVRGERRMGQEVDDATAVWAQVATLCRDSGIDRVLGIVDITGPMRTASAYFIANNPEAFGWERRFRLAVVDVNDTSRQTNLFTETVARNRGYVVRVFADEPTALDWLLAMR